MKKNLGTLEIEKKKVKNEAIVPNNQPKTMTVTLDTRDVHFGGGWYALILNKVKMIWVK